MPVLLECTRYKDAAVSMSVCVTRTATVPSPALLVCAEGVERSGLQCRVLEGQDLGLEIRYEGESAENQLKFIFLCEIHEQKEI